MQSHFTLTAVRLVKFIANSIDELSDSLDGIAEAGLRPVFFQVVEENGRYLFIGTVEEDLHIPLGER